MVTGAPSLTRRAAGARALADVVIVVLRVVAVLLLVVSAVAGSQAAWSRWAVCFVGGDPPVDGLPADRAADWCLYLQDHLYDYTLPSDPWVPIADAAQREGVSLLALGAVVVLVSLTVVDRWYIWLLTVAAGGALGTMWVVTGLSTLLSGQAGEPVEADLTVPLAPLIWLMPWVTIGLAVLARRRGEADAAVRKPGTARDGRQLAVFWAAMTATQPFPEYFITLMMWPSHDSSPLEGFFRCTAVTVAAAAVALTLISPEGRSRLLPPPLRWVGRVTMRGLATVSDRLRRADTGPDPSMTKPW
ncbi:hypothetical protein [Georgenia subflava]|uniref:Uncharacterized protein n=1 Tax=Georgenia subflava TaxID=1622177 RepID=A0A6N7EGK5_9MICO|nr:hypothetical protein [Georgenia subflava]MPV37259.1 hypothetical protein [Georgenia subflava]